MYNKLRLLIIEDEPAIVQGLVDVFVYHGYDVDSAMDGQQGLDKALTGNYCLILLDVMLPSLDGFSICNRIRQQDLEQPIIMLTAKSAEEDIINGLSLGADDYLAKPFSVRELVLRVSAVLKRSRSLFREDAVIEVADGIRIDSNNLLQLDNTPALRFTRREVQILQYLQNNEERPVPREELLAKVWGLPEGGQHRNPHRRYPHCQTAAQDRARSETSPVFAHCARGGLPPAAERSA